MIKITHIETPKEKELAKKIFKFLEIITNDYFEVKTNDGNKNNLVIRKGSLSGEKRNE